MRLGGLQTSSRNGSRRLLTGVFFSGIYKFVPGQGGEGGGAATEEQSSPLGRKYAGGEYIDDFYLDGNQKLDFVITEKLLNFRLRSRSRSWKASLKTAKKIFLTES